MQKTSAKNQAPQRITPTRRQYNAWVANESIEDFSLRYTPASIRKWSPWLVSNTSVSTASFLAMEAFGATILWQYGFNNAFFAALVVCLIISLASWAINYYAARYNIDIDLLSRGAGFGYIGSTITSLVYASFTFIFLAFEAAIMAMALQLALNIPLSLGYLISALVILPLVIKGISFINKLQMLTQPFWLVLLILPWFFVLQHQPDLFQQMFGFSGISSSSSEFNLIYFGAAASFLFALITQVGEQADYLRFLPREQQSKKSWYWAIFLGGPLWSILGFIKMLMGMLLLVLALQHFVPTAHLTDPTYLYWIAYQQMIPDAGLALILMLVFVCLAQIKINVSNAYAGSLAWSNFFARLTHSHPGRLVWLIFNIVIAIILMEMQVIHIVEKILGLYSNIALAWIGALVADLVICKPLGLSPKGIEFRRAYLYDINPVGVGALIIASLISISCYIGLLGLYAKALAGFIALASAMISVCVIAYITKGKYYLARQPVQLIETTHVAQCGICQHDYELPDLASCPAYQVNICSLCCSLEARCHDLCKPHGRWSYQLKQSLTYILPRFLIQRVHTQLGLYLLLNLSLNLLLALCLSMIYFQEKYLLLQQGETQAIAYLAQSFFRIYIMLSILMAVATWWILLNFESRQKAEQESQQQTELLITEIDAHYATHQDLLKARNQAEQANQAKNAYLMNISHELRTPLNSIVGYSKLMQQQEQHLTQQGESALHVIQRSGHYLNSLVDDLLDFNNIESGKIYLNMTDIDFPVFMQQLIALFQPQFLEKNILFIKNFTTPLPHFIKSDEKRLEQIFINLLGNALKFTHQGAVHLHLRYSQQSLYITVEDSGCGISPEDLEHIFKPFERGRNVAQLGFKGIGLGLSIVKMLVTALDGEIEVKSKVNQGTKFQVKFYMPEQQWVQPILAQPKPTELHALQQRRILVVDNEAVDRQFICDFLQPFGVLVQQAASGIECLHQVASFQPELILMDWHMPLLDGFATTELLRKNLYSHIPVIMISAAPVPPQISKADLIQDFLVKPMDLQKLLDTILHHLHVSTIQHDVHTASSFVQNRTIAKIQQSNHQNRLQTTDANTKDLTAQLQLLLVLLQQGDIKTLQQQLSHCQSMFPEQQQRWQQAMHHVSNFELQRLKQLLQD